MNSTGYLFKLRVWEKRFKIFCCFLFNVSTNYKYIIHSIGKKTCVAWKEVCM